MLKTRLMVSLPFVAIAVGAIFWRGWPGAVLFLLLATCLILAAIREFFQLTAKCGFPGFPGLTALFAVLLLMATILGDGRFAIATGLQVAVISAFMLIAFLDVFKAQPARRSEELHKLMISLGGFLYLVWTLNFIAKIYFSSGLGPNGRHLVFFLILVTKMADVGAYAAGTSTARRPGGNHKLVPRLSPKKSWEGLCGGLVAAIASAIILVLLPTFSFTFLGVPVLNLKTAIFFAIVFTLAGLLGDLAESALKRAARVKDSGHLPGVGGALDMLDSLIPAAPLFYACLLLLHGGAV